MKLDPDIYIAMHSVLSLKPGVTVSSAVETYMRLAELGLKPNSSGLSDRPALVEPKNSS